MAAETIHQCIVEQMSKTQPPSQARASKQAASATQKEGG